jgi:hypothetical protein
LIDVPDPDSSAGIKELLIALKEIAAPFVDEIPGATANSSVAVIQSQLVGYNV